MTKTTVRAFYLYAQSYEMTVIAYRKLTSLASLDSNTYSEPKTPPEAVKSFDIPSPRFLQFFARPRVSDNMMLGNCGGDGWDGEHHRTALPHRKPVRIGRFEFPRSSSS